MATHVLHRIETPVTEERRIRMTFEEFLTLPENLQAEWVDGEAIVFMTTTGLHARLITFLTRLVADFADEFGLGEVLSAPYAMRLRGGRSFREPDLMFVRAAHRDLVVGIALDGPADLVVEIVSEDSTTRDRAEKFAEYQEAGVSEYWIFDPRSGKERVDFYRLGADGKYEPIPIAADGKLRSSVLPGFWFRIEWLRSDPLPLPKVALAAILAEGAEND